MLIFAVAYWLRSMIGLPITSLESGRAPNWERSRTSPPISENRFRPFGTPPTYHTPLRVNAPGMEGSVPW